MAKVKQSAPFTRKGLHRVTCDECQGFGYFTVSQLERGMPVCVCGEPFRPERYELAVLLGVDHPAEDALERDGYNREMSQVRALRGYQRAGERYSGIGGSVPENMHHRALDVLRAEEREAARLRRGRRAGAPVPVVEMAF
jgi:hypothetical protein